MKKNFKRRKLQLLGETINVLKVLSPNELLDAKVAGGSNPNCDPTGCPTGPESQTK